MDKIYPLTPGTLEYSLAKHIKGEEERGEREYEWVMGFQNSIRANFPFMVMLSQSLSQVDPPGTASGEGFEQVTVFISCWPASYSVNPEGRDLTITALARKVFPERQRDTRPQLKSTCPTKCGRIAEKQQQQQNNVLFYAYDGVY